MTHLSRERAIELSEDPEVAAFANEVARHSVEEYERRLSAAEQALMVCAEFGCDQCRGPGETCLDLYPAEPNEWCQTCIAIAALARLDADPPREPEA